MPSHFGIWDQAQASSSDSTGPQPLGPTARDTMQRDGFPTCLFRNHMHAIQTTLKTPEHMIYPFPLPSLPTSSKKPETTQEKPSTERQEKLCRPSTQLQTQDSFSTFVTPPPCQSLSSLPQFLHLKQQDDLHMYILLRGCSEVSICKTLGRLEPFT